MEFHANKAATFSKTCSLGCGCWQGFVCIFRMKARVQYINKEDRICIQDICVSVTDVYFFILTVLRQSLMSLEYVRLLCLVQKLFMGSKRIRTDKNRFVLSWKKRTSISLVSLLKPVRTISLEKGKRKILSFLEVGS